MGLCSDQPTQLGRIPCHKLIAGKVIKALFCACGIQIPVKAVIRPDLRIGQIEIIIGSGS